MVEESGKLLDPEGVLTRKSLARLHLPRVLRHGLTVFILILVVEYLVIPQLVNAGKSLQAIEHVNIALLLLALGLEVAAQLAYASLTMVVLPPKAISYSKVLRINMSALGVSHILPGGTAGGTGLGYRLMTTNGVAGADVGFAAATQGIGSAIVLNGLLWLALIVSIPITLVLGNASHASGAVYIEVAAVGTVLLSMAAGLIFAFTKGQAWATRVLRAIARRLPFVTEDAMEQLVLRVSSRLRALGNDRRLLARAISWAVMNWLLDAACLWLCLTAFHYVIDPVTLIVAYGVGNVLAAIPLTPGGLGPVEYFTGLVLRGFGVPAAIAALAVIAWRLYNFWLPIPVGAACYVSLRVQRGTSMHEQRRMLGTMASEARAPVGESSFEKNRMVHPPFEQRAMASEPVPEPQSVPAREGHKVKDPH
ncbi:MAG: lysylphosphatidylglycerol synthase transmembrane domain-containing protein [Acidimicrobiales bacterium]